MPVHEIRYRAWEGEILPPEISQTAVAKFTLMNCFTKPFAVSLFLVGSIQMIFYLGYLYIVTSPLLMQTLKMTNIPQFSPSTLFDRFFSNQIWLTLPTIFSLLPKIISSELANRALPMIYSRPISRVGYIFMKAATIWLPLSYLTWIQGGILWLMMWSLYSPEHAFHMNLWGESLPLLLKVGGVGVVICTTLALVGTACSTMTKNPRFTVVITMIVLFVPLVISTPIEAFTGFEVRRYGIMQVLGAWTDAAFRADGSTTGVPSLLVATIFWWSAAFLFMWRKLKPVEIFSE